MKRVLFGFITMGLVAAILVLFVSCDITKLLGSEEKDDDDGVSSAQASQASIESFVFRPEDNPDLDEQYSSLIAENGEITAFLPATIVASGTPLEAKVTLSKGATISPDPRTARSYSSPVEYTVTSYDESETKSFVVKPQSRSASVSAQVLDFSFDTTGENDELVSPINAEISGTTIFLELPYQLMQQDSLVLEPSVTVSDGATFTPTGPIDFKSTSVFTVTGADGSGTVYSINTTIDPDTLTFLDLENPFYVDASNVRTAFTADSINFASGQQVVTVQPSVWDVIDGQKVGFFDRNAPYNGSVNVDPLVLGEVPPYTVTVTSANGEWSEDHEITLDRITPSATGIKSSRVRVADVVRRYRRVTSRAQGVDGWVAYQTRSSPWWVLDSDREARATGAADSYFYTSSAWISDSTKLLRWEDVGTVASHSALSSSSIPDDGFNDVRTFSVENWKSRRVYNPDATTPADMWIDVWEYRGVSTARVGISGSIEYTPRGWLQLHEWELVLDDYAWPESILEGPLSEGVVVDDSGANKVLTFSLPTSSSVRHVGEVATFDVVAESGDRQTYTININN